MARLRGVRGRRPRGRLGGHQRGGVRELARRRRRARHPQAVDTIARVERRVRLHRRRVLAGQRQRRGLRGHARRALHALGGPGRPELARGLSQGPGGERGRVRRDHRRRPARARHPRSVRDGPDLDGPLRLRARGGRRLRRRGGRQQQRWQRHEHQCQCQQHRRRRVAGGEQRVRPARAHTDGGQRDRAPRPLGSGPVAGGAQRDPRGPALRPERHVVERVPGPMGAELHRILRRVRTVLLR
mmetsp:Transcript_2652/g.10607  ORF Transcript_2652/g.10607 Transcript_2652/m.10607 type:complete len:242 (+) Transcript_2652:763-1488(+)